MSQVPSWAPVMPAPEPRPGEFTVTPGCTSLKASIRVPITSSMEVEPLVLTVPLSSVVSSCAVSPEAVSSAAVDSSEEVSPPQPASRAMTMVRDSKRENTFFMLKITPFSDVFAQGTVLV